MQTLDNMPYKCGWFDVMVHAVTAATKIAPIVACNCIANELVRLCKRGYVHRCMRKRAVTSAAFPGLKAFYDDDWLQLTAAGWLACRDDKDVCSEQC